MSAIQSESSVYGSDLLSGQIRLLEVLLPAKDNDSRIEVRLSPYALPSSDGTPDERKSAYKQLPWYCALSYPWGDEQSDKDVYVQGVPFKVTRNLHAALRDVRASASWPVCVWVDRICINQKNKPEKTSQIKLMREIYHCAAIVIVSLGETNTTRSDTKELMRSVTLLARDPIYTAANDLFFDVNSSPSNQPKQSGVWNTLKTTIAKPVVNSVYRGAVASLGPTVDSMMRRIDVSQNSSHDEGPFEQSNQGDTPPGTSFSARFQATRQRKAKTKVSQAINQTMEWKPSKRSLAATFSQLAPVDMARRLDNLFSHRTQYFSRIWTLEEAAVGKQVAIDCGGVITPLADLVNTASYLQGGHLGTFSASTINNLRNFIIVNTSWQAGLRLSLQELLFMSCDRTCYDPEDNIVALLGLVKDRHHPLLEVDHKRSTAEVFAKATMFMIRNRLCMDVICWPRDEALEPFEPPLPSWVPDFRVFANDGKLSSPIDLSGRKDILPNSPSRYFAGFPPPLTDDWRTLPVQGVVIGLVATLSPLASTDKSLREVEGAWNTTLSQQPNLSLLDRESLAQVSSLHNVHQELNKAQESANSPTPHPPERLQDGSKGVDTSYLMTLLYGQLGVGNQCTSDEISKLLDQAMTRDQQGDDALNTLYRSLQSGTHRRRLAITANGLYGSAPETCCETDMLCLLQGCSMPMLLRREHDSSACTLVGPCYVPRYIDEEVVRFFEQYQGELEEFLLM